jgi:hypothetical protein
LVFSEQLLDDIPRRLIQVFSMSCDDALSYCENNINQMLTDHTFMRAGTSIPTCSAITYTAGAQPGNEGAWTGNAFGTWDIYWPSNFFPNNPRTYLGTSNVSNEGEDFCEARDFEENPVGSWVADGSWDMVALESQSVPFSVFPPSTGICHWVTNCEAVITITDVEEWFYLNSPGCVAPVAPSPPWAGGPGTFLIPRAEDPEPVEQKATIPTLDDLIKLSNHTFQFTNNFGRHSK